MNLPSAKLANAGSLITESPLRDLEAIIRSRTPLIAMESNGEPQIVSLVREIAKYFSSKLIVGRSRNVCRRSTRVTSRRNRSPSRRRF